MSCNRVNSLLVLLLSLAVVPLATANEPAETPLEKSNRVLQELNAQFAQHRRPEAPKLDALPQPSTTVSPSDLAQQFSTPPVLPINAAAHELLVFVSFSMPREGLLRIVEQSEKTGAKMVFRGMAGDKLTSMSRSVADILGNHRVEALIHPQAFTQFKVDRVPALVLAKSDAGNHLDNGCVQTGSYIKVTGDVGQDYALDLIERTSPQWAAAARQFNNKLARGFNQ